MQTNAQLLRGERYEIVPGYQQGSPDPSPAMAPMAATPAPAPQQAPSDAALLASPQASAAPSQPMAAEDTSTGPAWMTPRRKAMYEKAKAAYRNYQQAVDQRRKVRKQSREYNALYNQMQSEKGKADQLENMMTNYKDLFRPDDPRTLQMIKQQMQHFETSERLRGDLHKRLQKYGIKSDPRADLPEDPFGDAGDEQFDQMIRDGYSDALLHDTNR